MQDTATILTGNKLIAEFMGYYFQGDKFYSRNSGKGNWFKVAKYDRSWDWLMPVVEKISKIEFERRFDEDLDKWVIWTHHPVTFGMIDEQGRPMVRFYCSTLHFGDTLIQAAYAAVVDFIQWHKAQKLIPNE